MPQKNDKTVSNIAQILAAEGLDSDSDSWKGRFDAIDSADVERALATPPGSYSPDKLAALISPASLVRP